MRLEIISGTAIHEFVEHCDSAAVALYRVRAMIRSGLRNIRVLTEDGRRLFLVEIEELAEDEADAAVQKSRGLQGTGGNPWCESTY
jgi:hypothetical protein